MPRSVFITASDTHAGKTWVTTSLVTQGLASGMDIQALKPIASGVNKRGINEDVEALALVQHIAPATINHVTYQAAKAPAIAARLEHKSWALPEMLQWLESQQKQKDVTLIEGVGGLMVPLYADKQKTWLVSDWLQRMPDVEVMLVVPLRLGCINHALLSCEHLKHLGKPPRWLVFNDMDNNQSFAETRDVLQPVLRHILGDKLDILHVPCGGAVPCIW